MRPFLLATALLFAGCLASPGSDAPPPAPNADATHRSFTLAECTGLIFVAWLPPAWVSPLLPAGYETNPAVSNSHLFAYSCGAVQVGGTTYSDVTLAQSSTLLASAAGLEGAGNDRYLFELVFDFETAPLLASVLQDEGWPVIDGDVEVGASSVKVVAATVAYSTTVVGQPRAEADVADDPERFHHAAAGPLFMDILDGRHGPQTTAWPVVLQADGGVWGKIAPGAGTIPGLAQQEVADGTYELHRASDGLG